MVITFHLHGELNALVDTIQVVQEVLHPVRAVWPDDKSVIHVTKPGEGIVGGQVERPLLKSSMWKMAMNGDSGEPVVTPWTCS